jgi:hypothetical protein
MQTPMAIQFRSCNLQRDHGDSKRRGPGDFCKISTKRRFVAAGEPATRLFVCRTARASAEENADVGLDEEMIEAREGKQRCRRTRAERSDRLFVADWATLPSRQQEVINSNFKVTSAISKSPRSRNDGEQCGRAHSPR